MSMFEVFFPLVGGVGLFLVGMMLLSRGLVAFAGQSLKNVLVRFTGTPWCAFGSGAILTAMMQSSTATTVTLIGFVSAGLIPFVQAIGVVIGASLGNTRSEERRVGKECRSGWAQDQYRKIGVDSSRGRVKDRMS